MVPCWLISPFWIRNKSLFVALGAWSLVCCLRRGWATFWFVTVDVDMDDQVWDSRAIKFIMQFIVVRETHGTDVEAVPDSSYLADVLASGSSQPSFGRGRGDQLAPFLSTTCPPEYNIGPSIQTL